MPKLKSFQQKKFARIQGVAHLNPMDLIDSSNSDEDDDFNKKLKGKYNIQKIPGAHVPTGAPLDTVITEEAFNNNEINEDTVCGQEIKKEPISQESEGWGDLENLALEPVQTLETPDFLKNEDSSPEQFGERKRRPMSSTPIPLDDDEIRNSSSLFSKIANRKNHGSKVPAYFCSSSINIFFIEQCTQEGIFRSPRQSSNKDEIFKAARSAHWEIWLKRSGAILEGSFV